MNSKAFLEYEDYADFWLKRLSYSARPHLFSNLEIEWAIAQTDSMYFGDYQLNDAQKAAVGIILWFTKKNLENKKSI